VKFAAAYGCDVTAFTSSENKFEEAKGFGANTWCAARTPRDQEAGRTLRPPDQHREREARLGRDDQHARAERPLHDVGAVLEPIPVPAFLAHHGAAQCFGFATAQPVAIETMLDFASRHAITPQTEHFPMSKINEAFARLESGKARLPHRAGRGFLTAGISNSSRERNYSRQTKQNGKY